MEIAKAKYRENTGSISGNLRSMPIGEINKEFIPLVDAARVRGLITQMHNTNDAGINAGIKFKTEAGTDSEGNPGIYVWRLS